MIRRQVRYRIQRLEAKTPARRVGMRLVDSDTAEALAVLGIAMPELAPRATFADLCRALPTPALRILERAADVEAAR